MSSATNTPAAESTPAVSNERNVWEKIAIPSVVTVGVISLGTLGWAIIAAVEFFSK